MPHHLLDVVYPDEQYSIAEFQLAAQHILADLAARGRVALLVGGSPHYLQAVVDRLQPAPRYPALRAWLDRQDLASPPERFNRWLEVLDPAAHGSIELRNRRRVLRALEVCLATGIPFSQAGRQREDPLPAIWIGLARSRASLHQRVERRIHAMLGAGWADEVRTLHSMGYPASLPSLSATGYREIGLMLKGELTSEAAVERIRRSTHAFIRRQETWLRAESRLTWFDADQDSHLVDHVYTACSRVTA